MVKLALRKVNLHISLAYEMGTRRWRNYGQYTRHLLGHEDVIAAMKRNRDPRSIANCSSIDDQISEVGFFACSDPKEW